MSSEGSQKGQKSPEPIDSLSTSSKGRSDSYHSPKSPKTIDKSSQDDVKPQFIRPQSTERLTKGLNSGSSHRTRSMREATTTRLNTKSEGSVSPKVCVCQPDPKIPRPRNAWILYRQHHQTNVIAQYPGLSEPEVSKILGDHWKNQPEDVKESWKRLAQDEKIRHQETYPDYRYQPRRKNRNSSDNVDYQTTDSQHTCSKCGGVTMVSPTTPLQNGPPRPILPPPSAIVQGPPPSSGRSLSVMNDLSLATPRRGSEHFPPNINIPNLRTYNMESGPPTTSPEAKRRRFTGGGSYVPTGKVPSVNQPVVAMSPYTREVFTRPDGGRQSSPPSSGVFVSQQAMQNQHAQRQESLTLPPMQLQTSTGPPRTAEELIMAMPFLGKIKTLGRISPPLKPRRPPWPVRGSIIAVEGDDSGAVHSLVTWLEESLNKSDEYSARVAKGPRAPESGKRVTLKDYLAYMETWHEKGREMIEYITRPPSISEGRSESRSDVKESSKTPPKSRPTPILLLNHYHLFASNAYACRIPIGDTYFPSDHWQWMATVWRGIVGPDYTIYIKDASAEELAREKTVEVKEEAKCIIIRRDKALPPEKIVLEDKSLRRLAFEIGEIVRVVSEGMNDPDGKERVVEETRGKR